MRKQKITFDVTIWKDHFHAEEHEKDIPLFLNEFEELCDGRMEILIRNIKFEYELEDIDSVEYVKILDYDENEDGFELEANEIAVFFRDYIGIFYVEEK